MFRRTLLLTLMLALVATAAWAAGYNYVKPELFKGWLESGKEVVIVDIQVPAEYVKRHFKGSLETGAYPVKSDEERARLDKTLERINATTAEVVIVCPRGGGGAKNTYDYLKANGVDEKRLFILEKGMEGWTFPEMCVTGK
jgi:rhodanese-related sulfurtransferase